MICVSRTWAPCDTAVMHPQGRRADPDQRGRPIARVRITGREGTDCCRGSGRLLREVGVEGCDAAGEAGLYLPGQTGNVTLVSCSEIVDRRCWMAVSWVCRLEWARGAG